MLIDSGAEISAIPSEYKRKIEDNKRVPKLSISGLNIYNAFRKTTTKASEQMLLPLSFNSTVIHSTFIIINQLNKGGIIGNDFLEKNKATLDFEKQTLIVEKEEHTTYTIHKQKVRNINVPKSYPHETTNRTDTTKHLKFKTNERTTICGTNNRPIPRSL